jgi:hypothetical protein
VTREAWPFFGPPVRGRNCGTCRSCCVQVPVLLDDEHKPANTRCKHLCSRGCGIYDNRPRPCVAWSCMWLYDPSTAALRRPDHSGYIIDPMPDHVLANGVPKQVVQVWVDPKRRDAHRDPALRAWLDAVGQRFKMAAIVRWSSRDSIVLIPPSLSEDGQWWEIGGELRDQDEIDAAKRAFAAEHPTLEMGINLSGTGADGRTKEMIVDWQSRMQGRLA